MRLTGQEDTDIALDEFGQPLVDQKGNCVLVSGSACWKQDIFLEALTEEGELMHEDEEGRWSFGFGMTMLLNQETGDDPDEEIRARIREKLTKREFIDDNSIKIDIEDTDGRGNNNIRISFQEIDGKDEVNIDMRIDGTEVYISD